MNHIISKTVEFILNNFEWFVIPLLIIMILKGIFCPLENGTPSTETILVQKDSLNISPVEKNARLQILLNSIHQYQESIVQNVISRESLKMQGRLLFITLFSGLITVLFSAKVKEHCKIIAFYASLVGLFWYGINVHKLDIENRGLPLIDMINYTEIKLINIPPDDNRLYYLDFDKLQKASDKGKKGHEIRKIQRFITPDISDMVFNMTPLLLLVVIYKHRKHSNSAA